MKLRESHLKELLGSAIAFDVIEANFQSIDGEVAVDLFAGDRQWKRRNDGRLTDSELRTYYVFADGGWTCRGLDAVTLEDSCWGCFKPDRPRLNKDGKPIKYEHPAKTSTEAFCLRVSRHQWRQMAKKAGVVCPDLMAIANEEIAKAFWQWVKETPGVAVVITEGAKKTASLLSHGYVALGLPGIYGGYRSKDGDGVELSHKRLIPQLLEFCQPGREFVFCFDNDPKPTTKKAVRTAIANTGRLIEYQDCKVSVMTWSGSAKGIDDVIAANGETTLDRIYSDRLPLEAYKLTEYTDLTPLISQTVNCRYLGDELNIPDGATLIGLRSAKGTGKTETLAQRVKMARSQGNPVIVLTHREQLAKELATRFGLPYRSQLEFKGDGFNGYVLCGDSLHPQANPAFNPARYPGAVVVLDEAEQVIWHLLNSPTCQWNRPAILETLTELVNGASQVILSDADLTRVSVDYINGLLETPVVPWVGVNEYNPAAARKAFTYDKPEALFSDCLQCIQDGDRLMIHTGAQKVKSKWGTINLEKVLSEAFPHLKILRIDAESVADPNHPAYGVMGNLNAVIPLYDIVIASPTLETGVSIDVKGHFNRVFCFAPGSQTAEAVCQSLARVREDVPRHIWVKPFSSQKIGNGATIPKLLVKSQQKLFKANWNLLGQAEAIANLDGNSPRHLSTWSVYSAIHNHSFKTYRETILKRLEEEGYVITESDPPDDAGTINDTMKAYAEANYLKHCENVAAAPLLDDQEYERTTKARAKTEGERWAEQKTAIAKRYLTEEVTPDLVTRDDEGLYGQLQLRYYLTIGRQFVVDRDVKRVGKLTAQTGEAFTPDINSACYSAKVRTLEIINVGQFLTGDSFTSESLQDWFETICQYRHEIKTILNQTINPEKDTGIGVAQRLLGLMGLKMTCCRRRVGGVITRFYSLTQQPGDRSQAFMGRWFERDSQRYTCDTPPLKELRKEVS